MGNRAVQFSPFAALKGYYGCIKEKEKIKEPRRIISEEDSEILSKKLNYVERGNIIKVVYYNIDHYEEIEGMVGNIDYDFHQLTIIKTVISFEDIYQIAGKDVFDGFYE